MYLSSQPNMNSEVQYGQVTLKTPEAVFSGQ